MKIWARGDWGKKLGSDYAEKRIKPELDVGIRLHCNETQDENKTDETRNAECAALITPHSGTIE